MEPGLKVFSLILFFPLFKWIAKGEPNDFKALKAHPFFEGLELDSLSKSPAPQINVLKPFNDSDDFEFDNLNPYKIKKVVERENNQNSPMLHYKQEGNGNPGNIVLTGLAMRKVGWLFYEPILLVLKDNKQLSYYDPETNKLKAKNRANLFISVMDF